MSIILYFIIKSMLTSQVFPKLQTNIKHQIDSDNCKCLLCTRVYHQMKMTILPPLSIDPTIYHPSNTNDYYIQFLINWSKNQSERLRFIIPEVCAFQNSMPSLIFIKRKLTRRLKMINKVEKLNFYEIKKLLSEGFEYHNCSVSLPSKIDKYQLIAIARYSTCNQLLSRQMLEGLFKANQRTNRQKLKYIQTLIASAQYKEIIVKYDVDLQIKQFAHWQRAKKQIQITNGIIKQNQPGYIDLNEQIEFEGSLNQNEYLLYLSTKLLLFEFFHEQDKIVHNALLKFVKQPKSEKYYFFGLEVTSFTTKQDFWGIKSKKTIKTIVQSKQKQIPRRLEIKKQLEQKYGYLKYGQSIKNLESTMYNSFEKDRQRVLGKTLEKINKLEQQRKAIGSSLSHQYKEFTRGQEGLRVNRGRRLLLQDFLDSNEIDQTC